MMRFLFFLSTAAALSVSGDRSSSRRLKVWDGVLPAEGEQRATLHAYASGAGQGHRCFSRPLVAVDDASKKSNNVIERTLDAILTEIENGSSDGGGGGGSDDGVNSSSRQYVEYWTRQEWRHIEAHSDVDENLSKRFDQDSTTSDDDDGGDDDLQSKFSTTYRRSYGHRYPIYGHVLYLQVGSDVRGPTCVFPGRGSGGDLLRSIDESNLEREECTRISGDDAAAVDDDEKAKEGGVQLVTVPAVAGRLLRFDGRDLHAVPRPSDLWMLPFVKGGAEYEPEEVWGRSVVLFNVWPADEDPPLDVPLDRNEEDYLPTNSQAANEEAELCSPFSSWDKVEVSREEVIPSSTEDSRSNQSVKVWLLGNERRRDHPMRTVPLLAPKEGGRERVREALSEKNRVTELWLRR